MIKPFLAAAALLAALAPLELAAQTTYFVSLSGDDGNAGTSPGSGAFRWPQRCVDVMVAGDTCIVQAGSYAVSSDVLIENKVCTQAQPCVIRSETPAVICTDPVASPDTCELNFDNIAIIDGDGFDVKGSSAWWTVEGFQVGSTNPAVTTGGSLNCEGTSGDSDFWPDNITFRFIYYRIQAGGGSNIQMGVQWCTNFTFEHSAFYATTGDPGGNGYMARIWAGTDNFNFHNIYCGGDTAYCLNMRNNAGPNGSMTRIVCDGTRNCLNLGWQYDRAGTGGTGDPADNCPNSLMTDGTTQTVADGTISWVSLSRLFARSTQEMELRYGVTLANMRGFRGDRIFVANADYDSGSSAIQTTGDTVAQGNCNVEPGDNIVRGVVAVNPTSNCLRLAGNGYEPNDIVFDGGICFSSGTAVRFTDYTGYTPGCVVPPLENCAHPTTTLVNWSFSSCSGPFTGDEAARLTDSHNNVFSCGSRSGTGYQTLNPQLASPVAVPKIVVADRHVDGARLFNWDGPGGYQEIIDGYVETQVLLVDAGTDRGTGATDPCPGASCDIGVREYFELEIPPGAWASCAVYQNGQTGLPPYEDPWIDGRTGLVVDVDCTDPGNITFAIGRCDDPADELTCDTDVYVHKGAEVRIQQSSLPIVLSSGASGSPEDDTAGCWRTRATWTTSTNLDLLTGIFVRYEIDPDGGTHSCATAPPPPEWAFQGID